MLTLAPVPDVPEIEILQAPADAALIGGEWRSDRPPPFWAFPWPGGRALARYLLDHPQTVRGLRVADAGTGCGLVAIAAALAGAESVDAVDTDPQAVAAAVRNAATAGVHIDARAGDLDTIGEVDVLLAGDLFYTAPLADKAMRWLRRVERAGADVLVGDAGRGFLPAGRFAAVARFDLRVRRKLEHTDRLTATVWRLRPIK